MKNDFIKGGLVMTEAPIVGRGYLNTGEESWDTKYYKKLPWQTIARTCAPDDAVKAVIEHHNKLAVLVWMDKYKSQCGFYGSNMIWHRYQIPYGPANETPEGEISIERIETT